jgi:hypothetical protein
VVSTGHPRREIDEFEKLAYASRESLQWANQTPVVVDNSGSNMADREIETNSNIILSLEKGIGWPQSARDDWLGKATLS